MLNFWMQFNVCKLDTILDLTEWRISLHTPARHLEERRSQSILKIFLEKLHPHLNSRAQHDFRCLAGVCNEVRLAIQSGILSSLQKLNYIQDFKVGFYSPCDTNNKKHTGIIPQCMQHSLDSGVPKDMICLDCQKLVCPLRDEHKVWLLEFKVRLQYREIYSKTITLLDS